MRYSNEEIWSCDYFFTALILSTQSNALVYLDEFDIAMFGASVNYQLNNVSYKGYDKEFEAFDEGHIYPELGQLYGEVPDGHTLKYYPNDALCQRDDEEGCKSSEVDECILKNTSTSRYMKKRFDDSRIVSAPTSSGFFATFPGNLMIGLVGEICENPSVQNIEDNVEAMVNAFRHGSYTKRGKVILMAYPTDFEDYSPHGYSGAIGCHGFFPSQEYLDNACAYNDWAQNTADAYPNVELIDPWRKYFAVQEVNDEGTSVVKLHADKDSLTRAAEHVKSCFEGNFGTDCRRYVRPGGCSGN